ncbi:MAG: hypothetical protein AAB393_17475, partial [Bacteroidota bacterium]
GKESRRCQRNVSALCYNSETIDQYFALLRGPGQANDQFAQPKATLLLMRRCEYYAFYSSSM